jgi:hypothetical protein
MPENNPSPLDFQPKIKGYAFRASDTSAQIAPPTPPSPAAHPPTTPPPPTQDFEQKLNKTNPILLLALEVFGLIAIFIIFLLILNFFNLISLSKMSPQVFGFLPHLGQTSNNQNQPKPLPIDYVIPQEDLGPFASCPVDKTQCKTGQVVKSYDDQIPQWFYGLEYKNLNPNTKILAVIPGQITTQNIIRDKQSFLQINIRNQGMNTLAQYLIPSADFSYTASTTASLVTNNVVLGTYKNKSSTQSALLLTLQIISNKSYMSISVAKDGSGINSQ